MAAVWDAATMSTGVAKIDQQHQMLLMKIQGLLDAMRQGKAKAEIEQMLAWLAQYATNHFSFEEGCMHAHKCPAAAANKAAHAEFIRVFTDFAARFQKEGATTSLVLEVERKLGAWVASHIVRIDVQLRPCVSKTGAAV